MKINWGTGIALVYGLFALTMIAVVFRSRSYDPGLVQKDYYTLDLNYQEHFDKKQNAVNLEKGPEAKFLAEQQVIQLAFPQELGKPAGKIKCYRSSTVLDDFYLDIKVNPGQPMEIPTRKMAGGLWHLDVDWEASGIKYFHEMIVFVNSGTAYRLNRTQ